MQLAAVAILLALVCLVIVEAVRYDAQIDEALRRVPDADPVEVSDERSGNVFMACFIGIPALLLAGWLAATALPLRRGSNIARILVFVAAGGQLLLCVGQGCLGLVAVPLTLLAATDAPELDPSMGAPPDGADWEQSRFLDTLYAQSDGPGAVASAAGGLGVLLVLALTAAVVVLLMVPDSRRWFRGAAPVPPAGPWPVYGYGYGPAYPPPGYGYGPAYPPPGQPVWPTLPPGYLACPDPALHLAHPPAAPTATTSDAGDAADRPDAADRRDTPGDGGPEQSSAGDGTSRS
ncbi:hypothetical protein Q2K19_10400 [Micromonospora soli]|uniref:hypothetical protein n=1 Tax=Micromonospora sp. NBRC 110009 TaxID=3061627 RepID=UPI002672A0F4|nr:hypothetical protein [Micromonospora sp. NBRC 110009]WKU00849.1 hypothetical protein Q2K19_10400 [Micromonospora sp. NBRC 110009]